MEGGNDGRANGEEGGVEEGGVVTGGERPGVGRGRGDGGDSQRDVGEGAYGEYAYAPGFGLGMVSDLYSNGQGRRRMDVN